MEYLAIIVLIFFCIKCFKEIKKGNLLLPLWILYISFETFLSIIASLLIKNVTSYDVTLSSNYLIVLLVSVCFLYLGGQINLKSSRHSIFHKTTANINLKILNNWIWVLAFFFALISLKVYFASGKTDNSFGARAQIIGVLSGIEFVIYKLGFILVTLIAYRTSRKKITLLYLLLLLIIIYSYSLYGGRFLLFTSALLFFTVYKYKKIINIKKINWVLLTIGLVLYLGVSIFFANTRYYMNSGDSFSESITVEKFKSTAFMQLGGNWLDFSRVESNNQMIDLSENFFPTILEGFLPSGIRDAFFSDFFKKRVAFGKYFADKINEEDNALRLNFTNEVFFSFGFLGIMFYSMLVGCLLSYFQQYLRTPFYPVSFFFFLQLLSLHILGSNTFSNTLILTALCFYIFRKTITIRSN